MQATVARLDSLLQRSDSDSMAWTDGEGATEAEELLAALDPQEWPHVRHLCSCRGPGWRACLASILRPQHGEIARHLMLDLAWDQDSEVAFLAVHSIAFYCGVNESAKGPFFDPKIQNHSFVSLAKAKDGLTDQIREVSASCHPRIQMRFGDLAKILSEK